MVNSDKGITNLHVPSDVIIDASMPAMIRDSGKMWGPDGKLHDTKALDPGPLLRDALPGGHRRLQGQRRLRPGKTMGSVPNVGLMAQKAEEYGSHDKTFEMAGGRHGARRRRRRQGAAGAPVETGDIFRMCQSRTPIRTG
jgi:isocitrate dehydrogenase